MPPKRRLSSQPHPAVSQVLWPSPSPDLWADCPSPSVDDADRDWDLREHPKALPTKADIQQLIAAVKLSCKQAIDGIREDTVALGPRVETLRAAHPKPHIDFDRANVSLFSDLSQRTLMQRHAVCPLIEALRSMDVSYRWGFPFLLMATQNRKSAVFLTKDDLLHFLETLDLPPTDFSDWRLHHTILLLQRPERWRQASSGSRKRNRTSHRGHGSTPSPTTWLPCSELWVWVSLSVIFLWPSGLGWIYYFLVNCF